MRILMLTAVGFFSERGMGFAIADRCRAISRLGHSIDLLCPPGGRAPDEPIERLRVIRLPSAPSVAAPPRIGPSLGKVAYNPLLLVAAAVRLAAFRYDCLHAHGEPAWGAWALARAAAVPMLYDKHFEPVEELAARSRWRSAAILRSAAALERAAVRRADVVVAISRSMADSAARLRPGRPTVLVENRPIEAMFELPDYRPPADPVVHYSGNFAAGQGIELLLESAATVLARRPEVRFELIGGQGRRLADAAAVVRRLGVEHAVELAGPQSVGQVAERMGRAAVLVSPRLAGDTPLKIYSYLAAGRPIVATDVPAHRGVLDATRARLADPTPEALAEAILAVLADPTAAAGQARRGRRYAREQFTWADYQARVAEALSLLPSRRR